jgi:3-oxoacyl-[acyl-carrier-protein] synthase II
VRVAITGMGVVSALGCDPTRLYEELVKGSVAVQPAAWAEESDPRPMWWAPVTDFDPAGWMDDRVSEGTDLFAQFALAAAQQAVDDAGLAGPGALPELRTAVIHGTSIGGVRAVMKAQWLLDRDGPGAIPRKTMIQIWPNMAAAQLCMRYGLHGPSLTVTTACASSIDAIGTAARMIEAGLADVAIAGGTEGGISAAGGTRDGEFVPMLYYAGGHYGMEAEAATDPARAMLPFDAHRSGIVTGEGSAMVVLESAAHAEARGAVVHGWVRGYGSLADGHHPSSPEPSGRWEARAMALALAEAEIRPEAVDALVAHATGTPKGDTAEIRAINDLFVDGAGRADLPVCSLKGHLGHPGASAGGLGVITGTLAMARGRFPHTAGTRDVDPEVRFDVVTGAARELDVDTLMVNAFGFGGQDASLVVTRSEV